MIARAYAAVNVVAAAAATAAAGVVGHCRDATTAADNTSVGRCRLTKTVGGICIIRWYRGLMIGVFR